MIGLTDDEREMLVDPVSEVIASWATDETPEASMGLLAHTVERIVQQRVDAERERIAQAVEAEAEAQRRNRPYGSADGYYRHAARIAREVGAR